MRIPLLLNGAANKADLESDDPQTDQPFVADSLLWLGVSMLTSHTADAVYEAI